MDSQIIPFCERSNRLKNAILKPKFTQLLLQTANLNRKMGRTEKKNPPYSRIYRQKCCQNRGVIQWLDAVRISTKEKTGAGKDAIKAELGLTEQQDTPQFTGKPMPRSRANYRRNVLKPMFRLFRKI